MPTWTFTTTDPATALQISVFCAGLGHVTETETPDKPAPVQARRKSAPIDRGCWRDPEARKLRAKVNTWVAANVRRKGAPLSYDDRDHDGAVWAYAKALGVTRDAAYEKIKYHHECEAEFTRTNGYSARP
jgi:hypothetical protein